jgi:hypothetical protein
VPQPEFLTNGGVSRKFGLWQNRARTGVGAHPGASKPRQSGCTLHRFCIRSRPGAVLLSGHRFRGRQRHRFRRFAGTLGFEAGAGCWVQFKESADPAGHRLHGLHRFPAPEGSDLLSRPGAPTAGPRVPGTPGPDPLRFRHRAESCLAPASEAAGDGRGPNANCWARFQWRWRARFWHPALPTRERAIESNAARARQLNWS